MTQTDVILSLSAILAAIGTLYLMFKDAKKKKVTIGTYLSEVLVADAMGLLMMIIIFVNIGEAIVAATALAHGHTGSNIIVRLFMHLSMALAGIISMMFMPKRAEALGKTLIYARNKNYSRRKTVYLFSLDLSILLIMIAISLLVPYWNLTVIAHTLGEDQTLAKIAHNLWANFTWGAKYKNPLKGASTQLMASWYLVLTHYLVTFVEGLFLLRKESGNTASAITPASRAKTIPNVEEEDKAEETEEKGIDTKAIIEDILGWYFNKDITSSIVVRTTERFVKKFEALDTQKRVITIALLTAYSARIDSLEDMEEGVAKHTATRKAKREFKTAMLRTDAGGLGITLSDPL